MNIAKALEAAQVSLAAFSGEMPKTLTDCCREILSRNQGWLSALQVRQSLHAAGFDFSEYKSNPLSSIHTTLKRIAESDQAETRYDSRNNENLYRWKQKDSRGATPTDPPPIADKAVAAILESRKRAKDEKK